MDILAIAMLAFIVFIATLAVSCYAFHVGNSALIEVKAMQRSTHQVQLVPADTLLQGGASDDDLGNLAGRIEHDQYDRIDDIIRDTDSLI